LRHISPYSILTQDKIVQPRAHWLMGSLYLQWVSTLLVSFWKVKRDKWTLESGTLLDRWVNRF